MTDNPTPQTFYTDQINDFLLDYADTIDGKPNIPRKGNQTCDMNSGVVQALAAGSLVLEPNGFPITEVSIVRAPQKLVACAETPLGLTAQKEAVRRAIRRHAEAQAETLNVDPDDLEANFLKLLDQSVLVENDGSVRAHEILEDLAYDMRRSAEIRLSEEPKLSSSLRLAHVTHIRLRKKQYEVRLSSGQEKCYRRWETMLHETGVPVSNSPELFGMIVQNKGSWVAFVPYGTLTESERLVQASTAQEPSNV